MIDLIIKIENSIPWKNCIGKKKLKRIKNIKDIEIRNKKKIYKIWLYIWS